ncbi:cystic fibrosis transmembrane conductance regulator-like [Dendronephthya gigantea]|uniref:cystic fibrosis transmembrane conductance regulator-like n=1 Tax=Dendronephthya gigantea TaxID=151771 RepID=UPI00106AC16D|nr:cystic fibrosis transmembrane conductance regulator-like [Dendronephthya gigantea]
MSNTKVHPQDNANFISKITLWWVFDLLRRGNTSPLNHENLYPIRGEYCAQHRIKRLEKVWTDETNSAKRENRRPKLWKAMLKYFTWREYGLLCFLTFYFIAGNIFYRYFVLKLIVSLRSYRVTHEIRKSRSVNLVYVWGMIIGFLVQKFSSRHINLVTPVLGMKARAALIGLIYQKVLKCSKAIISAEEVMELICNDTQRIVLMADKSFPYIIRKLVVAFIYICWLASLLEWKVVPGLLVFVFFFAFRILVTNVDVNLRRNASRVAEKRLGYLREFLTSIHSVKLNCLEEIYERKIQQTRWQEIKFKAKRWIILSISLTFNVCLSNTILLSTPLAIHFTTDIMTALYRIQLFFERAEVVQVAINANHFYEGDGSAFVRKSAQETSKASQAVKCSPHISLNNLSSKLPKFNNLNHLDDDGLPMLNSISLERSSTGLTIITGSVGSGKSSLLASILGEELPITSGFLERSGSIAYVSDKPWVFPGTVRENILFGKPYDKEWYYETVRACQLEDDFIRLPANDLSGIGENGATLSGGQSTLS